MREQEMPEATETTALRSKLDSFDDVLPCVGDFGKYQFLLFLALFPYSVAYATLYFSQFFLTLVPQEHWCRVDDLLNRSLTQRQRVDIAIPKTDVYPFFDRCRQKNLNFSEILSRNNDIFSNNWDSNDTIGCSDWEYNFTQIPYASIGAELDWVCDKEYLISTAQAIFFCGSITGGFLFGWIADHKGRIPALVLCNGVALLASIATANTYTFWSFAVCRFFTGLAFDNVINIPLIIVMEYMAVNRRSLVVNIAFGIYFAFASTMLPWVAYYLADWRYFAYFTALPMASSIITPWILPESSRWYVSNGMTDNVIKKLKKIARINGKKIDPQLFETFKSNLNATKQQTETATWLDLFRTPRLAKNTILLTLFWSLTVVVFDGHVYSLKLLPSSVFVSFSLACATELPAGLILAIILDRWGRRFCGFITIGVTVILSSLQIVLTTEVGKLVVSILARFALNMAANVGLQYAAELLPTPVRAQGVSLIHIFGIIAHSLAPYIVDTAKVWYGLPMLIITILAAICAFLVLFLPETLGTDLPQTLEEGEDFGKDQTFWSVPCCESRKSNKRRSPKQ